MTKRRFSACACSLAVSAAFVVCGLVICLVWPAIFRYVMDTSMVVTPQSHVYRVWKDLPMRMPIDFYFFNWTNPDDVYDLNVKPKFREVGPYRFLEKKQKSGITWNSNGTITYKQLKHWYPNEEEKGRDLRDSITTINPVSLSAAYTARSWGILMRKGVAVSLANLAPKVHVTRTVSQLLFEGYDDHLISIAKTLPFIGALPPGNKFGWFFARNGSEDYEGVFNMGTGINSKFGGLYNWNYRNRTSYFEGDCARVDASAGEFFHPNLGKEAIRFFSADLCRIMVLEYAGTTTVKNVVGNKYIISDQMLDNGTLHPESDCYCNGECIPSGVMNVSSCRFGSPSFASLPHFYRADPYYADLIEGMKPNQTKHEFFMVLEETTGVPLAVGARLQINLLMQPIPGTGVYEGVPRVMIPVLWFQQTAMIPDDELFYLRLLLNLPVICTALGILLVCVGAIMLSCLVYTVCTTNLCGKKKEKYLYREQSLPLKSDYTIDLTRKQ